MILPRWHFSVCRKICFVKSWTFSFPRSLARHFGARDDRWFSSDQYSVISTWRRWVRVLPKSVKFQTWLVATLAQKGCTQQACNRCQWNVIGQTKLRYCWPHSGFIMFDIQSASLWVSDSLSGNYSQVRISSLPRAYFRPSAVRPIFHTSVVGSRFIVQSRPNRYCVWMSGYTSESLGIRCSARQEAVGRRFIIVSLWPRRRVWQL